MKKSEFIKRAKNGIYFIQSIWNRDLDKLTDLLNNANNGEYRHTATFRTLQNETQTSLKFKLSNDEFSYVSIAGTETTILEINNFIVVRSEYSETSNCSVIYTF